MKNLFNIIALTASLTSINFNQPNCVSAFKAKDTSTINYSLVDESTVKDYYSNIEEGLKGDELLSALQTILSENHVKVDFNSGYTEGVSGTSSGWYGYYLYERNWDLSPLEDSEKNGDFKTSDIWINVMYLDSPIYIDTGMNKKGAVYKYYPNYPDTSVVETVEYSNSHAQFDREHVFPKSFGFNGDNERYKDLIAGCDAHNLHAADHVGNSTGHNNLPFGNVANKDDSKECISDFTGEVVGYVGLNDENIKVFEPNDKDKGDIARSIFYMCARYHEYEAIYDKEGNLIDETPALTLVDNSTDTSTLEPIDTKANPAAYGQLDDLLMWNVEDPVSDFEIYRNDLIYNNIQGNRNPFVDYPDWASACFDLENTEGASFSNFNGKNSAGYTFTLNIKDKEHTFYFLDKFDYSLFETSLLDKDGNKINPVSTAYYLDGKEIKNGDSLLVFGDKKLYASAKTSEGYIINSDNLTINVGFSTIQIIIGVSAILILLIIIGIIYFSLSKKHKKKVNKTIKNRLTKSKNKK